MRVLVQVVMVEMEKSDKLSWVMIERGLSRTRSRLLDCVLARKGLTH